jgi:hypothetical protein
VECRGCEQFNLENDPNIQTLQMHLNFSGVPLAYGIMTMPWYVTEEGRLLLDGFITESVNSYAYSLSIRSCHMFLISLLKSSKSRPATNFWSAGRAKQVLANQRGPRQGQHPLGRAPLATADKDADHIALISRSGRSYSYLETAHTERTQQQGVS